MASQRAKDGFITLRVDAKVRKQLEEEAEKEGLLLSSYLRNLIYTHPKRQQQEKGKK